MNLSKSNSALPHPIVASEKVGLADGEDWKEQYAHRITDAVSMAELARLPENKRSEAAFVTTAYPCSVTPYYLSLARTGDPEDPILKQVLPDGRELGDDPTAAEDPLQEEIHTAAPGLVHRYPDRALVLLTNRCAVHCRHCTRKRLWRLGPRDLTKEAFDVALQYLGAHTEIRDVLLSGGDPLVLPDGRLDEILGGIRRIRHVEIIRIGSRIPVVLPQRITPALCRILEKHGPVWFNTQFNHPRELTSEAAEACERLLRAGVPVNNQSVLLRGVNDDVETMKALCAGLLRIRVRPYYLHQCDPVRGVRHFRTSLNRGIEILEALQGRVSGLAIPRYMVDLPGRLGKVPLAPAFLLDLDARRAILRTPSAEIVEYENPPDRSEDPQNEGLPL